MKAAVSMNRKIYRRIARQHGVSVKEGKRDIQSLINEAYRNPTQQAQSVPRKGEIPTPDEFIDHVVRKIKEQDKPDK